MDKAWARHGLVKREALAEDSLYDMTESSAGQIVAMGGGGFSMEPDNPLLDDFVLGLAPQTPARICFLPTASGDSAAYIARFYRAFSGRAVASDLTLFGSAALPRRPANTGALPAFFDQHDIFYVGGGNTANLVALWRTHGIDQLLRRAWERGAILSGVSAGMICWFQGSLTDSFGADEALHDGLGLLPGSACPHYDSEPSRRPNYQRLIAAGFPEGYAADDGVALHFRGNQLVEVVSSHKAAAAYRVGLRDGEVCEERLLTRYLGAARR